MLAAVPNLLDHLLFVILIALFPVWAVTYGFRRLNAASDPDVPRVRRSIYRWALLLQWTLVALVAAQWMREHRDWVALGVIPRLTFGVIGVGLGLIIVMPMIVRQRRQAMLDPEAIEALHRRLARLERMLPHTREELIMFSLLSITAGICEEVLYRGYLIWYLSHWVGLITAAALSAVIFGLGHAYQGGRGMLQTGAVGAFLAAVYLVTGSLLAPIVIHAFMDLHSGRVAYDLYARDAEDRSATELDEATPDHVAPDEPAAEGGEA
jgi:membrane protease YdiL (CAAX protease family)